MNTQHLRGLAASLTLPLLLAPSLSNANPSGAEIAFGSAEISGGNGRLTIFQGSEAAIINWDDFSIARGELTEFIQPSSRSAVLNRVVTGNPSAINGALRANGSVFVINPNGIIVGPSGQIDVGGTVLLSTLDIDNDSFLAGGDLLFKGRSDAGIVNMGRISAIEGDVFLFGNTVSNQGSISASNGTVGLAAGSEVLLSKNPDGNGERVFVKAGGFRADVGVENAGSIEAAAAELKAHGNFYALAINNSGSIRATGVARRGGGVFLRSLGGRVENTGSIEATVPGSRGGRILIEADTFDMGGSMKTDPEGDIELLVRQANLLPGATIGDEDLGQLITESTDSFYTTENQAIDPMASARRAAGDAPTGKISAAGRFNDGATPIISSRKNGRVMIGMPGISRTRPGLAPNPPVTHPSTAIIRETASASSEPTAPTRVDPSRATSVPGTSVPADAGGRPPLTPATAEPGARPAGPRP